MWLDAQILSYSDRMNIAYIGLYDEKTVNGVNMTSCTTATELSKLGHNVYFYGFGDRTESYKQGDVLVRSFKSGALGKGPKSFRTLLKENPDNIDVFHIRSVFRPENWFACRYLKKYGHPYAISTHGGYDPQVFKRNPLKKFICYHLFDKHCLHGAQAALTCGGESEVRDLRRLKYASPIYPLWDPIDTAEKVENVNRNKELLYLGRFDVECKGLDILLKIFKEIQTLDPNVSLNLHGDASRNGDLEQLRDELDLKNVFIKKPVYGQEKERVIKQSNLYVQTSRWESFGRSIAEAMVMGVPVVTNEVMNISTLVEEESLGITVNENYSASARKIVNFLNDKEALEATSTRCHQLAKSEFSPNVVAQRNIDFYLKYFGLTFEHASRTRSSAKPSLSFA